MLMIRDHKIGKGYRFDLVEDLLAMETFARAS